jgi:hypothetical protein
LTSGSTQSVSFSCSNLPTGASCSFSPTSCNPTCSSTTTISTSSSTPTGTYSITISGTGGGKTEVATYNLTVSSSTTCTKQNPTVSISPSSQSGTAGSTNTYTISVTNNDNAPCDSSIFDITVSSCPSGWICNLNKNSVKVSPSLTDSSTAINNSYQGEGSASYTIQSAQGISLNCDECSLGTTCKCSISGSCNSGIWLLTSKNKALSNSILSDIPPFNISYMPVKAGVVDVKAVCFDQPVVKRAQIQVKANFLVCPAECKAKKKCSCDVNQCDLGFFVAYGTPLASPVIEDVADLYTATFKPKNTGTINVVAMCFDPAIKVEKTSINIK